MSGACELYPGAWSKDVLSCFARPRMECQGKEGRGSTADAIETTTGRNLGRHLSYRSEQIETIGTYGFGRTFFTSPTSSSRSKGLLI